MSQIVRLPEEDFTDMVTIVTNAYPGLKIFSPEQKEKLQQQLLQLQREEPTVDLYGLYREGRLLGVMRLHDFRINLFGITAKAGGVGLVAVDLLHKKKKVARDMIYYFLEHCRQNQAPLALLYPFRPDFYKRMGFGYGTKMNQYRLRPEALPKGPSKAHIHFLQAEDKEALRACYDRFRARTHGMLAKSEAELDNLFKNQANRIVAYREGDSIRGYIVFSFVALRQEEAGFLLNDIRIHEFVWENQEALSELLTFLQSQHDQIHQIVINTQDEYFHHLLLDPRNGTARLTLPNIYHESNTQGVGLMYRVVDTAGIFETLAQHDFGGQTCQLRLTVRDSFFPENDGSTVIHFEQGRAHVQPDGRYEVEVTMDVAEFSATLVGIVPFRRLWDYGLAEISDPAYAMVVDRLFQAREKPLCTTPF